MRYLLLLIPTCLIGGCQDDDESEWWDSAPSAYYEANGFRFGFHGPRDTGYAPDAKPSLDTGLVDLAEIGLALETEAVQLAGKTGMTPSNAIAILKGCDIRVIDDYNFAYKDVWAAGRREGNVIWVSLWARTECNTLEEIPLDAPGWTIRAPDFENLRWRYGYRALLPVVDHELGHVFFGPHFEH